MRALPPRYNQNVQSDGWDGPHFRTALCGTSCKTEPGLSIDFVLNAGRSEVVWWYVKQGRLDYETPDAETVPLPAGSVLFAIQPHQGKLVRPENGVPCATTMIHLIDPLAVTLSRQLIERHGVLFQMAPDDKPHLALLKIISYVEKQECRSAHFWSILGYQWFMTWCEWLEENARKHSTFAPRPSRILPLLGGTLADYADQIGYSPSYMSRKLKKMWGENASNVLRRGRLEEAARLLRTTDQEVREIARTVGYASPSSFNHAFVNAYGQTPLNYRHDRKLR